MTLKPFSDRPRINTRHIMSHEAVMWAKAQHIPSSPQKLLAILIADRISNETGECFPGQQLLAEEASMCERQVRQHLKALTEAKHIGRRKRFRPDGTPTSDVYWFPGFMDWLPAQKQSARDAHDAYIKSTTGGNPPLVDSGIDHRRVSVSTTGGNPPPNAKKKLNSQEGNSHEGKNMNSKNSMSEQDRGVRCKKHASELSRGDDVEDVQRMVNFVIKPADVNGVMAGGRLFKTSAYRELKLLMDKYGANHTERAIVNVLTEIKLGRNIEKGCVWSWSYFEGAIRDWAARHEATKVGVELEECPW
jgi:hypothetical protein